MYLVGAGPGDPGLITLRGQQCLQQADVVLYDYLVNPVLARWAPPQSLRICLGKHGENARILSQEEIHQAVLQYARAGKQVVRLKGGDPAIFARLAEEVSFLQKHRIPFEIVPGITAAMAVSSYAGIPLTHRDHASAVALITGHEDESRSIPQLDFASLAKFPGTLVIYMGVTTACQWVSGLIQHGMRSGTPVALIRRCSLPDQRVIRCTLEEVPHELSPYRKFPPPVVAVIGEVVGSDVVTHWFDSRRLSGQRLLITRPNLHEDMLERRLLDEGATILRQPAVELNPVDMSDNLKEKLHSLSSYDGVIFTSAHGVQCCMEFLAQCGLDGRCFSGVQIAAIGPATARRLESYFLKADIIPDVFRAENLAIELMHGKNRGDSPRSPRFLLFQADRARSALADQLRESGGNVELAVVYQIKDVAEPDAAIRHAIDTKQLDWVVVTSVAIVKSLYKMFGDNLKPFRMASLSPRISDALRELGLEPTVEAAEATMPALVEAILAFDR